MEGEGRRNNTQVQSASYPLGGKIMLSTIMVVFSVVMLILCLHIYARCCVLRQHRRDSDRRIRRRRSRLVFAGESGNGSAEFTSPVGMDVAALRSLPVFVFSAKGEEEEEVECAVCLSELGDGEVGRLLPECKHGFHIDCIDMWLLCHSTCPLCRVAVHPPAVTGVNAESVELRPGMNGEDQQSSSSSFNSSASSSTSPAWLGLKPPAEARTWFLKVIVGRDGSSPPTSHPGEVDLEGGGSGGGGRDHGLQQHV